ncbi:MAG: hypothetical protein QF819_00130 [Gemmatimonadota bacterium]|nr:hypothetical protein [Gemmatimonadota bacterium]MDP7030883.1 hypothetical protein [Gemmatimonadota bacterium]
MEPTRVRDILLIATALAGPGCCGDSDAPSSVRLLPFPPPFRAALAISSDIDDTETVEEFLAIQDFLCGSGTTPLGPGLGMEVGNSFWFFDATGATEVAWFSDDAGTPSLAATTLEELIAAGFVDVLHSWGDFSEGGFRREYAERGARELAAIEQRTGRRIRVWVNHGNPRNSQSVGPLPSQLGDNPESSAHHTDLLRECGIRFTHKWEVTRTVGQDAGRSVGDFLRACVSQAWWAARKLCGRLPRGTRRPFADNVLLHAETLDDGTRWLSFRRYIGRRRGISTGGAGVAELIAPEILDDLTERGGVMIVYTHLGDNDGPPRYLPPETVRALRGLARRAHAGEILVATTARILAWTASRNFLRWSVREDAARTVIEIAGFDDPATGFRQPDPGELDGITFAVKDPSRTRITVCGQDAKGVVRTKSTVGFPWAALEYPR